MRLADRAFATMLLLLGVAYFVEATRLPVWMDQTVGAGLFPMLLGTAMLVVTGAVLALGILDPASLPQGPFLPQRVVLGRQASVLAALAVYILALEPAGFIISTFAFVALLSVALERSRRISAVAVALLLVVLAQVFLVSLLKMPLPRGPIG